MNKTFIAPTEAARRIGTSAVTIRRWYHQGALPGRRLGGRIEIEEAAVVAVENGGNLPLPPEAGEADRSEGDSSCE